jgi:YggT family protein
MIFVFAAQFVGMLVWILSTAIFLRAIFSWFVSPGSDNAIMRFLVEITEPVIGPLRRVVPTMGSLDLTPFVAMILLQLLGSVVQSTLIAAARAY